MTIAISGLDGQPVNVKGQSLAHLSARLDGSVIQPSDPPFEEAVRIWNGMISKRPALVVRPVSVRDVQEVIGFARATGLLLSIKGGGHNIAGTSLAHGGLTLDMSQMRTVAVDAERRIAHVGAGCLLGDVDRATQEHGLATVLGFISETGVAGLTLGGGFGYLTRRFGWTVDNLDEVEIVTADGKVRRASEDEHQDLFWAVRGGGGNFGVVTRFTFRLHQVGPVITGGLTIWDANHADEIIGLYRQATEAAPRELTLVAMMRLAPSAPYLRERWHGKPVIAIIACHTGDPSQATADLAPIRAVGKPIADLIAQKPYVEQQSMFNATQPKGMHNYWKTEFLPALPDNLLDTYRQHAALIASSLSHASLFHLGGALSDYDAGAAAFGNRDAAHIFFAAGTWPPDTTNPEEHRAWVRSTWDAIRPYSTGGNYINVQTADEDETRLQQAYRESLDKLEQTKAIYDPDNLFRVNRNIRPASTPASKR